MKKFGVVGLTEIRGLKQFEDENSKRKKVVADLSLDNAPAGSPTKLM